MKIDVRRDKILDMLKAEGKVSVSELSRVLGATPVTIRSDLTALEREGRITRVSGGAVLPQQTAAHSAEIVHLAEKQKIAKSVAAMLHDGDTLFINSGTTSLEIAKELRSLRNLNIVTNSLAVASELGDVNSFRVFLLGGEINTVYGFTYGGDAQEQLGRYQADWAILSVDGISGGGGITTYHAEEGIIDRMMIAGAKQTLIAADCSKIGRTGFSRVTEVSDRMKLLTDRAEEGEELALLREKGLGIIFA